MGFWGRLFGSSHAVNAMVDGVTNGLDALVYTDEEKSLDAAKERSEARGMLVNWMAATQGQNLARRFIALVIAGIWVFQYFTVTLLSIISIWAGDPEGFEKAANVIGHNAEQMNAAMMLVLGFYFAAPHMELIAKSALERFSHKSKD
ncbi:hypothetical protein HWQ46_09820 [Shewanella sp. D64]|uniref:hypothetical protein n=1 Tax=unclassified Shewanella TaxID=196818 RepID=UPI0022BA7149|nr:MULTISPECIES: hypothetical protein [unclassified Shewanella]MEC4725840.1 hypothetical protein [Shewanella sp. D64]MEC4737553.1 hypothetical protein [Shewanella sp. E94]WBJ93371.1 hypothetical protein HWQ47_15665 [Shewanella sp. MTB7]